ncbi:MAG: 50S ribosomal protein L17 [Thermoanaerobaculales bacterium]|nr:50S ribosomal protein L17 [Thermoanaerobaculales bacterium]
MRHRVRGRKLGRTTAHRKAMFRNQLTALFTHERIITTVAKAKELRPLAERMVTLARTGSLANRRRVLTMVPDKETVKHLFDTIAPRFVGRDGGYTRIMRLGRRKGDGAELAIIEFVDFQPKAKGGDGAVDDKGSLIDRAKGIFGGGRKEVAEVEAGADEAVEFEAGTEEQEPEEVEATEETLAPVEEETAPEVSAVEEAAEEPEGKQEPEGKKEE